MKPMEGIRVVEVAAWTFVPAAGAVLAEWGAEVLKIEHPDGGDPQRGLVSSGLVPDAAGGVNYFIEQPNHGKKSVAINLQHPAGRDALYKLCETADVFLTNWLPGARQRAQLDVEHIRAVNPNIVYVRGHGHGVKGPDADKGAYDASSFFARAGVMNALKYGDDPYGPTQPAGVRRPPGGLTIAGSIAAASVAPRAHGRGSGRRRVAARLRDVGQLARHRHVEAVRAGAAEDDPRQPAEPARQPVPHQGRPAGAAGDVARRALLARAHHRGRPRRPRHRRALHVAGGVVRQPRGRDAHPRRDLRHSHVRRVEGRPRRREGRVGAGADGPRPVRRRAGAGKRLPRRRGVDPGRPVPARHQPDAVQRGAHHDHAGRPSSASTPTTSCAASVSTTRRSSSSRSTTPSSERPGLR